jgi:hypothetical protein
VELVEFSLHITSQRIVIGQSSELRIVGAHDVKSTESEEFGSSCSSGGLIGPIAFRFTELLQFDFGYVEVHLLTDRSLLGMSPIDFDLDNLVIGVAPYLTSEKDDALFARSDAGFVLEYFKVQVFCEKFRYLSHYLLSLLSTADNAKEQIVSISDISPPFVLRVKRMNTRHRPSLLTQCLGSGLQVDNGLGIGLLSDFLPAPSDFSLQVLVLWMPCTFLSDIERAYDFCYLYISSMKVNIRE